MPDDEYTKEYDENDNNIVDKEAEYSKAKTTMTDSISTIRTGVYGEDVRDAIADAIEQINSLAVSGNGYAKLMGDLKNNSDLNDLGIGLMSDMTMSRILIHRLKGSFTYSNKPSDFVSGQLSFLVTIQFGTNVKQFIFYFGGGTNVMGKIHMRVRNKVNDAIYWGGWTTVDLLNMNQSTPTSTIVLG